MDEGLDNDGSSSHVLWIAVYKQSETLKIIICMCCCCVCVRVHVRACMCLLPGCLFSCVRSHDCPLVHVYSVVHPHTTHTNTPLVRHILIHTKPPTHTHKHTLTLLTPTCEKVGKKASRLIGSYLLLRRSSNRVLSVCLSSLGGSLHSFRNRKDSKYSRSYFSLPPGGWME